MKYDPSDVLCLSDKPKSQSTVRRHYIAWRLSRGLVGERCDNTSCEYFLNPLVWDGKPLKPILDHKSGNRRDNTPDNLQFLCPNCDSQNSHTKGGANAGRIKTLPGGGYHRLWRDGRQDGYAPGQTIVVTLPKLR